MSQTIDLENVAWWANTKAWHAVREDNRWRMTLCSQRTGIEGSYSFTVTEYRRPPIRLPRNQYVCEKCAAKVDELLGAR